MGNKEKNCYSGNSYNTFNSTKSLIISPSNSTKPLISTNPGLNPIYYLKKFIARSGVGDFLLGVHR